MKNCKLRIKIYDQILKEVTNSFKLKKITTNNWNKIFRDFNKYLKITKKVWAKNSNNYKVKIWFWSRTFREVKL